MTKPDAMLRDPLALLLAFALAGYMLMGRSFSHLGVAPVYIGEIVLAVFFIARPLSTFGPALGALLTPSRLTLFALATFVSIGYGLVETLRGISAGHERTIALQNLVFHVYPLFVWIGLAVGTRHPSFLARLVTPLAWCNAVYGLLYVLVLAPHGLTDTTDVYRLAVFGQPNWTAGVILAVLSFSRGGLQTWLLLAANSVVLLALQSRTEWLCLIVCLPLWGVLTHRLRHVAILCGAVAGLLLVGYVADVRLPSPESRHGGEISVRQLWAQVWVLADPTSVRAVPRDIEARAGTFDWRLSWWQQIWKMVHSQEMLTLVGPGYGYPIWELHPYGTDDFPLRTPHNVFIYALGYTGWIGVAIAAAVLGSLLVALWRNYEATGQALGICLWTLALVRSMSDNFFESPYFAIVLFTMLGLVLAQQYTEPTREWAT